MDSSQSDASETRATAADRDYDLSVTISKSRMRMIFWRDGNLRKGLIMHDGGPIKLACTQGHRHVWRSGQEAGFSRTRTVDDSISPMANQAIHPRGR
ncbi:hypothetical protein Y032_0014g2269 [Ancylostoma ceylanicum]|uniref:Uncharacterized protein n=1 Tax=Ancylostoma ceylanicum TaxID=53326 RepID=A0A016V9A9_9BILA|nr:hypothetical protein Y032_0014g2269 [Ancylostoma ceylanicum]